MTFSLLPSAIRSLGERITREVNRVVKEVAKEILETAADGTPVDTTKALSNWQVGVGSTPVGVLGPRVPGLGGVTKAASLSATVNDGVGKMQGRKVGVPIHIANNAHYIDGLNDGSISKKGDHFVEDALVQGRIRLSTSRLRLN